MDYDLLIRVYRRISSDQPQVKVGTAYPVATGRILTARHVLADGEDEIDLSKLEITWFYKQGPDDKRYRSAPAELSVEWDGLKASDSANKWDAVILACSFPNDVTVTPSSLSNAVPQANKNWESRGFPAIGQREDDLYPTSLQGKTFGCAEADPKFQVFAQAKGKDAQGWCGASGAPVFADNRILGLIVESCDLTGGARIDAIPMFRLLQIPTFRDAVGLPSSEIVTIDPVRFQAKIVTILIKEPSVLELLEDTLSHKDFVGKAISVPGGNRAAEQRAEHLAQNIFNDFESGKRLLQLALHECEASKAEDKKGHLYRIAYLYFPARFAWDESRVVLTEFMHGVSELIDARAASVASIELRMAAIEERAADYDPDQTRADGPVGRRKIHDPPALALEAIGTEEFREAFAKLLFEKTSSRVKFKIKNYSSFCARIDKKLKLGNDPRGSPYIILNDPGDKNNAHLTKVEMSKIAHELRSQYKNLFITYVSDDEEIVGREYDYLDWFWETFSKK